MSFSLSPAQADLVLRGGSIWLGPGKPRAQALAARAGRVIAIGRDPDVHDLIGARTRVVDLRGRLVVPGFNDAHVHFLEGGHGLLSVDLRTSKDEADMAERLEAHAAALPPGTWIRQGNWDHRRWTDGRLPSRLAADAVTPEHPVLVNRLDGHMALANSLALRLAGVDRNTPDPLGGRIERDSRGEPTGILMDNALDLVRRVIPEPSREQNRRAAKAALAEAARLGVTTVQDDSAIDALPTYLELHARGELSARMSVWRPIRVLDALIASGMRPGLGDDWVRLGPLKILADGSLGAGTAAMHEDYSDEPGNRGLMLYETADLEDRIVRADAAGFALAVHAIGDRANQVVLDAFEKAVRVNGGGPRPFRIEHAQTVTRADLARYRALGVIASVQPSHAIDDLRFAERRLGPERCATAYNVRSFLDAGVEVAFGTDWYVEPLDPRLTLYAAVTRERPEGGPAGGFLPAERVTLEQAVDLYTRGSARAERAERDKGTLAPGRLADCVVFAADIFAVPSRELLDVPVDVTVVGGRVVHERDLMATVDARGRLLAALQDRLGHRFADPKLLDRALTHASHAHEREPGGDGNNEALEFLGDAVLGFVVADLLHRRDPAGPEGLKSKGRASLVSAESLAERSQRLELPALLRLGRGEEKTGGRKKAKLWANAYEAVIAALYLDGGLDAAAAFVRSEFEADLDRPELGAHDAKSALQELLQARGEAVPEYVVIAEEGPSHRRLFRVECRIGGAAVGTGEGTSKKAAQQEAARLALEAYGG